MSSRALLAEQPTTSWGLCQSSKDTLVLVLISLDEPLWLTIQHIGLYRWKLSWLSWLTIGEDSSALQIASRYSLSWHDHFDIADSPPAPLYCLFLLRSLLSTLSGSHGITQPRTQECVWEQTRSMPRHHMKSVFHLSSGRCSLLDSIFEWAVYLYLVIQLFACLSCNTGSRSSCWTWTWRARTASWRTSACAIRMKLQRLLLGDKHYQWD